jgi:hypothetical protein
MPALSYGAVHFRGVEPRGAENQATRRSTSRGITEPFRPGLFNEHDGTCVL